MVHGNAYNISMAANLSDNVQYSISCAAHNIQLKDALDAVDIINEVIHKGSKIVQYFNHSNVATIAFIEKEKQLNLNRRKLIQSCPTSWGSYYYMCERLIYNRTAIMSVLTDRTITKLNIAAKLDMSEHHWAIINDIITVLKPLDEVTTTLCSLVLPIIHSIINNHLKTNDVGRSETEQFKSVLVTSLTNRFKLNSNIETVHGLASFLDPRSKQLSFENNEKKKLITAAISNIIENCNITVFFY
ncbi:Zinc finger BED domain-containing protein 1 [Habropoda laboriosa]|uniref:Zinc finger BED domain-containing protein 1 n=1 Tax=Habropoda laboriosa TaxID=597456 RepID=A0A0L7QRM8_9HYME|nr:Zinc finger BED domain-containing protein 1 [Habropoda laboriosa]